MVIAGCVSPVIAGVTLPKVVLPIMVDMARLSGLKDLFDTNVTVTRGTYARFHLLSTADLREVLDLDGDMRQVGKLRQSLPEKRGLVPLRCRD